MSIHGVETIASLSDKERAEIFTETASDGKMTEAAIEKDFWVCWTLQRIFSDDILSKQVLFKGGTSLSKCYGLIERFSEDIDLILDWRLLTEEDPYQERSNTQQDKFNKAMEKNAGVYINDKMLPQVNALLGDNCQLWIEEDKPRSIMLTYPKAFSSSYIKPEIELEFGPMSAMTPNSEFFITPYCSNVVKNIVTTTEIKVRAIEAKKTFWDKVTILHVEAHRPENKNQPARYSRHYYDLYQMINSSVVEEAMADLALLDEVVEFKAKFYPQNWANYQGAKNGEYQLIPERFRVDLLVKDYAQMKEMIFGHYPDFDDVLSTVKIFQQRLTEVLCSRKMN